EFSIKAMKYSLPNHFPMGRRSMHGKYGLFDDRYKSAGDWEMWLRAIAKGSHFLKIKGVYGLRFWNLQGLSLDPAKMAWVHKERKEIYNNYKYLWGER